MSSLQSDRRAELERARLDEICKGFKPELTMAKVYSQVDCDTTIEQIIRELEQAVDE
jgi:hypothetical protein